MTANTARPIAPSGFQPRIAPGDGPGWDKAEYARPSSSGLESGFYVESRGLPWHVTLARRLNVPELMTGSGRKLGVEEALILAGMDWDAALAPQYAEVDGRMVPIPGKMASYRTDTGAILGDGLSTSFKIVQWRDAFRFGDFVLDTPGTHIESAGVLFGGRAGFVSFEVPDEVHVANDPSDYRLFLLISNGHDGRHQLRIDITVERALCKNTVRIGQERSLASWSIRHTSGLDGRVTAARNALGITHRYVETFTENASKLAAKSLADRQVDAILDRLYPLTEAQKERVAKDPEKRAKTPQGIIRAVYDQSPSVDPIRGTAWGLYNAVTEYVDHFRGYRDGAKGDALDNRAEALMFDDSTRDPKARALEVLLAKAR